MIRCNYLDPKIIDLELLGSLQIVVAQRRPMDVEDALLPQWRVKQTAQLDVQLGRREENGVNGLVFSVRIELVEKVDDYVVLESSGAENDMFFVSSPVTAIRSTKILPLEPETSQMFQLFNLINLIIK